MSKPKVCVNMNELTKTKYRLCQMRKKLYSSAGSASKSHNLLYLLLGSDDVAPLLLEQLLISRPLDMVNRLCQ